MKNAGGQKYVWDCCLKDAKDGFLVVLVVVAFSLKGFMPGAMWICVSLLKFYCTRLAARLCS